MYKKSDGQLVVEVQNGHISSYEELVRRYEKKLYIFIYRIVNVEDDAKDIVQDAFISVYKHIEYLDAQKGFSAYLYQTAKNGAMTLLRSKKKTVSIEKIEIIDDKKGPLDEMLTTSKNEAVRSAINMLDGKYKQVVSLYYFDDLSYEEIAKQLVMPINTVRTYLRRAKMQLKSVLQHEKY